MEPVSAIRDSLVAFHIGAIMYREEQEQLRTQALDSICDAILPLERLVKAPGRVVDSQYFADMQSLSILYSVRGLLGD